MLDNFKEDIAVNRRPFFNNVLYALCWVMIVIFALYAAAMFQVIFMTFDIFTIVTTVLAAALAILLFIYKDHLKLEYEYTFTNGSLDFAKVLRAAKRKELGSMTVANVSACGHVAHASFQRFLSMKDVKKKNWFLNRDGNLFYFYYVKDNEKNMIIIEPSEEMVEMIKRYLPAGVYQG
ncbi:MAG: hypothetical protein IKV90_06535 [Clostridia bacterium]|nr:hypothetical protein [Clostridia bacterium]